MLKDMHALVIDPDPATLTRIAGLLDHGFRISTRLSPADAMEYVARARPHVVLLGIDYWQDGWGSEILAASPETVVVPVLDIPDRTPEETAA